MRLCTYTTIGPLSAVVSDYFAYAGFHWKSQAVEQFFITSGSDYS